MILELTVLSHAHLLLNTIIRTINVSNHVLRIPTSAIISWENKFVLSVMTHVSNVQKDLKENHSVQLAPLDLLIKTLASLNALTPTLSKITNVKNVPEIVFIVHLNSSVRCAQKEQNFRMESVEFNN